MSEKIIVVSAGIIEKEGKILIAQRKKDSTLEPNKWEFPGGKVELFEDPKTTLIREIKEELDISIEIKELFDVVSYNYELPNKKIHIILIFYNAKYLSGKLKNIECQDSKWINKKQLINFEFAGGDKPVVEKLLKL